MGPGTGARGSRPRRVFGRAPHVGCIAALALCACGPGGSSAGTSAAPTPTPVPTAVGFAHTAPPVPAGTACTAGSALQVDSGYTLVCLADNEQIFGVRDHISPQPCFDQQGDCLDPTSPVWPGRGLGAEAQAGGVPFWIAANGGGDRALESAVDFGLPHADAQIPVPAGRYSTLYFVGAAGNGPGLIDIAFRYGGGGQLGESVVSQTIDDWCAPTGTQPPVGSPAFRPQDRWNDLGEDASPGCGVFEYAVAVPTPQRSLSSVVFAIDVSNSSLGGGGGLQPNILAVTLR